MKTDAVVRTLVSREEIYLLLSFLLREVPSPCLLEIIKQNGSLWDTGSERLNKELECLSDAVDKTDHYSLERDFHTIFLGVTRGEVLPYASWYLTGQLNHVPLMELRTKLNQIGIARMNKVGEPEDHLSALFEVMALLQVDDFMKQREIFNKYIGPWGFRFFQDMERVATERFYATVAKIGQHWVKMESERLI